MKTIEKFQISRVLFIAGLLFISNSIFADASTIKGHVMNSKKQPLNYATATLMNPSTMEIVEGDMCDNKGEFKIENVKPGEYILSVRMLGYAKDESKKIVVGQDKNSIVVKNIILNQAVQELNEVVVTANRPLKQHNPENAGITYLKRFDKNVNMVSGKEKKDISKQTDNVSSDLKNQLFSYVKELQSKNIDAPESTEFQSLRSEVKLLVKGQNDNMISGLINQLNNYLKELQSKNVESPETHEMSSFRSEVERFMVSQFNDIVHSSIRMN